MTAETSSMRTPAAATTGASVGSGGATEPDDAVSPARRVLRTAINLAIGPLRVVLVLVVIAVVFQSLNSAYLEPANISNLLLQIVPVGLISVGVVVVLLMGEIDLSVGAVSGVAGALLAVLIADHGWNPYLAIVASIGACAFIGVLHGLAIVWLELPAFIVTLAGLLAYQGVQILILGDQGTKIVTDPAIVRLAGAFLPDWLSIVLLVVGIAGYCAIQVVDRNRRVGAGVEASSVRLIAARSVAVAALVIVTAAILFNDRGISLSVVIFAAVLLLFNALVTTTKFGRHMLAVGGNVESARRVGVRVRYVRVMAFVMASALAAAGGIMATSRLQAATQSAGGSDLLLLAIAGPVVAGVSLFGGRGSVWAAAIGAVVIGAISNGMDLLGYDTSIKYVVTGAFLFVAVALDALARLRRRRRGLP